MLKLTEISEAKKREPNNLLDSRHMFAGIDEIIKKVKSTKLNTPPNKETYDKFIENTLNQGGNWSSTEPDSSVTCLYVFLENWGKLMNVKMNKKTAVDIMAEVTKEAGWQFRGSERDKNNLDSDLMFTFDKCKKGYEFFFALMKWSQFLAMSYPFKFKEAISKVYGKDIVSAYRLQSNAEYILGTERISNTLWNALG